MPSSFLSEIARQDVREFSDAAEMHNKRVGMWNRSTVKGSQGKALVFTDPTQTATTNDALKPTTDATGQYRVPSAAPTSPERMTQVAGSDGTPLWVAQTAINGKYVSKPGKFSMKDPSADLTVQQTNDLTNPQPTAEEEPGLIARMLKK